MEIEENSYQQEQPELIYNSENEPSWLLATLLGFQHIIPNILILISTLTFFGPILCILHNDPSNGYILSSIFMASGIATLLNLTLGSRLPIFLVPGITMWYNFKKDDDIWYCPSDGELYAMGQQNRTLMWQERVLELQGAVICFAILKTILGLSGLVGIFLRFSSPLVIATIAILSGKNQLQYSLLTSTADWYLVLAVIVTLIIFSQFLSCELSIPCYTICSGWYLVRQPTFRLFSVLSTMVIVCVISIILSNATEDIDIESTLPKSTLNELPWITFNYPFQFGWPTFSKYSFQILLPSFLVQMIASVGEFHVCSTVSDDQPPSPSVSSRGIGVEGIASVIGGIFGIGTNIGCAIGNSGIIGITKACSKRAVFCSAIIMIIMSFFVKVFGFLLYAPKAVINGLSCGILVMYIVVGMSLLHYINMKSRRNLFVFGISLYTSHFFPELIKEYFTTSLNGYSTIFTLLTSETLIGTIVVYFLDNVIPGSSEDRGIIPWRRRMGSNSSTVRYLDCFSKLMNL